ncbi:MAG: hypothetical protein HPY50_10720 [Firmicutes bacterium]|nr:hypothetical protein [Bacillota bacterium]
MSTELNLPFEKLIKGQANYKSDNLSFNLLIARLQKKYTANQTQEELKSCLQEMNAYFVKYAVVAAKDVEALRKL